MKSSLKQERSAAVNDDESVASISGAGADSKATPAAVNDDEADEA